MSVNIISCDFDTVSDETYSITGVFYNVVSRETPVIVKNAETCIYFSLVEQAKGRIETTDGCEYFKL